MLGSILKALTTYQGPGPMDDRGGSMPLSGRMSPVTAGGGSPVLSGTGSPVMARSSSLQPMPATTGMPPVIPPATGSSMMEPVGVAMDDPEVSWPSPISEAITGLLRARQGAVEPLGYASAAESPAEGSMDPVRDADGNWHIRAPDVIVPVKRDTGARDWATGEKNLDESLRTLTGKKVGRTPPAPYGRQ